MKDISRRAFIKQTALGVSAAAIGCGTAPPAPPPVEQSPNILTVPLGKSGLVVPRLAMGTGSNGWRRASDQTRIGQKAFNRVVARGVERGAAFIDAADLYGIHKDIRKALRENKVQRDKITILSKVWVRPGAAKMHPSGGAKEEVDRFRKELGMDYIDICLVHDVRDRGWPERWKRVRDDLSDLKSKGIVRAVGCSCHSNAALNAAAESPWVDVIFGRINPFHASMDQDASVHQTAETLKKARANGKGVIGIKIYGCGKLSNGRQRYESLKFVLRNKLVDAMSIGFVEPEQIDDTVDNIKKVLKV
jgi:aryl-alcohol dehydrogenase-like predicted oxidoreductase